MTDWLATSNDKDDEDREWEILHKAIDVKENEVWVFDLWLERPEMEQALWDIEAEEKLE